MSPQQTANLAVIFDMDGVIVNNHNFHVKAWKQFTDKYDLSLSDEDFKHHVNGRTVTDVIRYLFDDKLSEEEVWKYSDEKEEIYRTLYKPKMKAVNGLEDLLIELKQRSVPVAVATSAPSINVDFTLDGLGLRKYFDLIKNSKDIKKGKPDPEIYLKTAALLNFHARNCVVFEDSISGIKSAHSAGMSVIALTTTHTKEELTDLYPDLVIVKDFTEIELFQLELLLSKRKKV